MAFQISDSEQGDMGEMSDINMLPMVDIMLVLLIIFIVTVPVVTHSVRVELPTQANVPPTPLEAETVVVSVTASGTVHWNDEAIDAPTLERRLAEAAQAQPPTEVHVRGDRAVAYEHVVRVMTAAQQAGVTRLGFVKEVSD